MTDLRHVAILIPAKNEEELLPRCLRSVIAACKMVPPIVSTDIIVVADESLDGTHSIACNMIADRGSALNRTFGCVGKARHEAALEAIQRSPVAPKHCWLANTDADCIVSPNWLVEQLRCADDGYAGVVGTIDIDSFSEHQQHVARRFYESYSLNLDGTHPHVHGANMGFVADAYLKVGGWSTLATGEDHDLWCRFKDAGYRLRSDGSIKVITSGRRMGRAPMGFAAALAAHNEVLA